MTRIIGIVLLQNEENFVTWAIANSIDFCDEMIVIDNNSTDSTWQRVEALARANPKIRLLRDSDANRTNSYLQEYIGKDVWVFGVDGDEIYDRDGLARLRQRILAGEFNEFWKLQGYTMHATVVDLDAGQARGYLTPAAAAATKLYNFAHIAEWTPDRQRLHGIPVIKPGYEKGTRWLAREGTWDTSDFRNLHMCFFPRSTIDADVTIRKNISDKFFKHEWRRAAFRFLVNLGGERLRGYFARRTMLIKQRAYMGGEIVDVALPEGFGRPMSYAGMDPLSSRSEATVATISNSRRNVPDLRTERELRYGGGKAGWDRWTPVAQSERQRRVGRGEHAKRQEK